MQNAKDLLFEVGQANYITVLDLTKGYWQIPMAEEAKPYSLCDSSWSLPILCYALRDEERREYLSKSYGSGASETPGILSIIYRRCSRFFSKTWEQHMKHLCVVFQTIQRSGSRLTLKVQFRKKTCEVFRARCWFRATFPRSRKVLPLTELTRNRVPNIIPWNEVAEQAFTKLKAQLVKAPSLYTPDLSKPYQLYTDASATAIGACLSQNDEKEALKRFDSWIFGAEIEVISDHNPLMYLTLTTPQSAKLTRWALALQRYNIAISYRKGVKHGNADALSRLPIPVS
ncbi:retrovirus-related Pol polyprotein from transposon 17.6 [Trichonephila clavipes]|nr:retrovirus-related Pol polyprotein from transposon 17.6 [Trichonephila clavipes]